MRGLLSLLLVCCCLPVCCGAEPLQEVEDALPPQAQELMDALDDEQIDYNTLREGTGYLWEKLCTELGDVIQERMSSTVLLLCVVLLCAVAEDCFDAVGKEHNIAAVAGVLAITVIAAGNMKSLIGMGTETIEQLDVFSKTLLPTLAAAVAASGGVLSAGVSQVATVVFAELLLSVIRGVLLPLVYFYIASAAAAAMLPEQQLERLSHGISKGVTWLLTGSLVLFTTYLTLSGAMTGSADALSLRLTRSAIGTAVPVVGSIIGDASLTILSGAGLLKNSIGVVGMLAVLSVCLIPFLHLGVQYLLYKAAAFLSGAIGSEKLMQFIDALGGAFGLVLGMTGSCALLLLISVTSSVSFSAG